MKLAGIYNKEKPLDDLSSGFFHLTCIPQQKTPAKLNNRGFLIPPLGG
jgi:hypothetical protein